MEQATAQIENETGGVPPAPDTVFSDALKEILAGQKPSSDTRAPEVRDTDELKRVANLPRRSEYAPDAHTLLTKLFAQNPRAVATFAVACWLSGRKSTTAPAPENAMLLSPAQAQPLVDLYDHGGAVAALKVGEGKTPVTFLAPAVVQADCTILIVPGSLKKKTSYHYAQLMKAWKPIPHHFIISYQELALEANANLLAELVAESGIGPTGSVLIVADECQALRNTKNAATRRVARFGAACAAEHRPFFMLLLSGTVFEGRGIAEYHHILKWTLGVKNMPLPASQAEALLWGRALDEDSKEPIMLGALNQFADRAALDRRESVRRWFGLRLRETPGVTVTDAPDSPASLLFSKWKPKLDAVIKQALDNAQQMMLPGGEEMDTDDEQIRSLAQLPWGFYMKWKYPAPPDWRERRKEWWKFVRNVKNGGALDTEFQIRKHVREGKMGVVPQYDDWIAICDTFEPETEVEWISDTVIKQIARDFGQGYVIWTHYRAVGFALEKLGFRFFREKMLDDTGTFIEHVNGSAVDPGCKSIVASIAACSTGVNLQYQWNKFLITAMVQNHEKAEQLIGRFHRKGQKADTVEGIFAVPTGIYDHALAAVKHKALAATHISGVQKLCLGDWIE
jgi:hypothetical protein